MNDTKTIQAGVDALLQKSGIVMGAERIPTRTDGGCGMPDDAGHWRITFKPTNGTPASLEFSQGTGHRVWGKDIRRIGQWRGQFHTKPKPGGRVDMIRPTLFAVDAVRSYSTYPKPHPADILYSCVLDSSACDICHAEWCENYGFDTDSIKADRAYRQCQNTGYALRCLFGRYWDELADIVRDY